MSLKSEQLNLLKSILPNSGLNVHPHKMSLPLWLKQSVSMIMVEAGEIKLCLIFPKQQHLEYDQLTKIQHQLQKRLDCITLLVADDLNPKYRALFVKNKIPFIYKDQSIFSPELGIKLQNLKSKRQSSLKPREATPILSPFELKIVAGYLTGQLNLDDFNLDDLKAHLSKQKYKCSKFKLSQSTSNLVRAGFMNTTGKGPQRRLTFVDKNQLWEQLQSIGIKQQGHVIETNTRSTKISAPLAHESALAKFSTLADPEMHYYAVTNKEFTQLKKEKCIDDFSEQRIYFDVRKEDPKLYSMSNCLNPIEVYFELKDHHDERIQIALEELLSQFKLKVKNV